jgi:nucleoside-diphosphate-sugar epimerase
VNRSNLSAWLSASDPQGVVIYSIGVTSDFRERPYATTEAHVGILGRVLQRPGVNQLTYLSSTRVYARSIDTHEASPLSCLSGDPSDIYNLSKLLGESLVLRDPREGLKVVRLSNVLGPGQSRHTFVGSLLDEARLGRCVTIRQSPDSAKDYVSLQDVTRLLPLIATEGRERLYNLGSGVNATHRQVASWLERQGVTVHFAAQAQYGLSFPTLRIDRLRNEFDPPGDPFSQVLV